MARLAALEQALATALCRAGHQSAAEQQKKATQAREVCKKKVEELTLQKSTYAGWCG